MNEGFASGPPSFFFPPFPRFRASPGNTEIVSVVVGPVAGKRLKLRKESEESMMEVVFPAIVIDSHAVLPPICPVCTLLLRFR